MSETTYSSLPMTTVKNTTLLLPKKKHVRFDSVIIRDMPIELGEHPASDGAPITIGWTPESTRRVSVDVFELFREESSVEDDFRLSVTTRAKMLLDAGYDIHEIANACEQARDILKQREESYRSQKWEVLQQAREKANKAFKKLARTSNPAA